MLEPELKPDFQEILIQLDGPLWKYVQRYINARGMELLVAAAETTDIEDRDKFISERNALEDFKTRFPNHVKAANVTLLENENE